MLGACIWGMKQTPGRRERNQEIAFRGAPQMAGERRELHEDQARVAWSWEAKARSGDGAKLEPSMTSVPSRLWFPVLTSTTVHPATHSQDTVPIQAVHCLTLARPCRMLYGPRDEVVEA